MILRSCSGCRKLGALPLPVGAMGFTHLKNESKFSNLAVALRWAARVVGFCAKHMNRLGFSFSPPAKTNQMCECRSPPGVRERSPASRLDAAWHNDHLHSPLRS